MAGSAGPRGPFVNHIGLCVSDLERSRRFYVEVLGFQPWWQMDVPDEATSKLLRIPAPLGSTAAYLVSGDFVLELMYFAQAGVVPQGRVMNNPGLTHISMAVTDIPATLEKVEPHGGEILPDTDMWGRAIMIRDPDGQLIELTTFEFTDSRPPRPDQS